MSRFAAPFTALTLALALGTTGCGDADVEKPDPGVGTDEVNEYLPIQVGNTWTFKVTKDGVTTDKVTTVLEEQPVGGTGPNQDEPAFFVRTLKIGSDFEDKTESWQATRKMGEGQFATVRYREISYHASTGMKELEEHWDPYKLRVDNFHKKGDTWDEVYEESKIPADSAVAPVLDAPRYDTWSVQDDAVSITVPAGTFTAMLVIRRKANLQEDDKLYWFVKGIGKVQEVGGQTEKLVDCNIGGKTCADIVAAQ